MAAGTVAGLGADLLMGRENQSNFINAQAEQGAEGFKRTHFNPYEGGYNQGQGGFRYGGPYNEPVRKIPLLPVLNREDSLPRKVPLQMVPATPGPYRFRSMQDNYREQEREIERQRLLRVKAAYDASLKLASGGPVAARHIIPENMAMEAVQRGDNMAIVPGMGTGTEDNVQMGGIQVSSGEGVMGDEAMREAAFNQGIAYSDFMMRNYPNTTKLLRRTGHFAYGGPLRKRDGYALGGPDGGPNIVKSTVSSGDVLDPVLIPYDFSELGYMPNEDSSVMPDISARSEKSGSDQGFDMEGFDKMNNASAIAGGALGLGSALYSAFQKRSIPPPPEEYKPQLLDLKTGAFANALEDRRKGAQVTGLYNFRGRQSLGGELGVLSAGLRQRNADAAAVEQVKNRQEEYNNQLINNAELGNIQRRDAYNQAQGEAQDRFRAMKGAAVSAGLNTMINAGSQWMQNRLVADAAATQAGLYGGYSLWQSGKSNDSIDELTDYQFNRRKNSRK